MDFSIHYSRDTLRDFNLRVKVRKGCGVFEESPEGFLLQWISIGEVAQYP